jgi:hypothetical protein
MTITTLFKSALGWLGRSGGGVPDDRADEFARHCTLLAFRRAEIAMDTLGASCGGASRFVHECGGAR